MSKPLFFREDDMSERAVMMRKAVELAFSECYYCEEKTGTSMHHEQPICEECERYKVSLSEPDHSSTPWEKAQRDKNLMIVAKKLFPPHDEVRAIDPPNERTPEQEELFHKVIETMRERGRQAKRDGEVSVQRTN